MAAGGCDGAQSVAERSFPTSEVKGRSLEDPMPEGWRPSGVTPRPRSCGCAGAGGPRGGGEEIPFIQGKEQQLRFAGAAVKRYPTSKVRETQVRR